MNNKTIIDVQTVLDSPAVKQLNNNATFGSHASSSMAAQTNQNLFRQMAAAGIAIRATAVFGASPYITMIDPATKAPFNPPALAGYGKGNAWFDTVAKDPELRELYANATFNYPEYVDGKVTAAIWKERMHVRLEERTAKSPNLNWRDAGANFIVEAFSEFPPNSPEIALVDAEFVSKLSAALASKPLTVQQLSVKHLPTKPKKVKKAKQKSVRTSALLGAMMGKVLPRRQMSPPAVTALPFQDLSNVVYPAQRPQPGKTVVVSTELPLQGPTTTAGNLSDERG